MPVTTSRHEELSTKYLVPFVDALDDQQRCIAYGASRAEHFPDDLVVLPPVQQKWVALLRDYVDMIRIDLGMQDASQGHLPCISDVFSLITQDRCTNQRSPALPEVIFPYLTESRACGKAAPAVQPGDVSVPDRHLQVQ